MTLQQNDYREDSAVKEFPKGLCSKTIPKMALLQKFTIFGRGKLFGEYVCWNLRHGIASARIYITELRHGNWITEFASPPVRLPASTKPLYLQRLVNVCSPNHYIYNVSNVIK